MGCRRAKAEIEAPPEYNAGMNDKEPSVGELLKQMAAIHARIAHLRNYSQDSESHSTELAHLNNELAQLTERPFPNE